MKLSPLISKGGGDTWKCFAPVSLSIGSWWHFPDSMLTPFNLVGWDEKRQTLKPKPRFFCFTMSELMRLYSLGTLANIFLHDCFWLFKSYALAVFTGQIPKLFAKFSPFNSQWTIPIPTIATKSSVSARWMIDYQIPLHKMDCLACVHLQVITRRAAWYKVATPGIMTTSGKCRSNYSALFTVYQYIHEAILRQNKHGNISVSLQFVRGTQ